MWDVLVCSNLSTDHDLSIECKTQDCHKFPKQHAITGCRVVILINAQMSGTETGNKQETTTDKKANGQQARAETTGKKADGLLRAETIFVSGHLDVTPSEFAQHYATKLDGALTAGAHFVVGDSRGADTLAQRYIGQRLKDDGERKRRVTVFSLRDPPRNCVYAAFNRRCGFRNDDDRDAAMTAASDTDIAWVRPVTDEVRDRLKKELGNKYRPDRKSGTQKNLERRQPDDDQKKHTAL
jgi:hypothetical protein